MFVSYPNNSSKNEYSTALIAFSPIENETEFTAKAHFEYLSWVLQNILRKNMTNVTSLIGDNCEKNKALANLCNVPLIGCASHRFNLVMEMFLLKYKHIIDKTNTLMGKLKNLKLAGKLRLLTSLCAIQRNTTQWSSTSEMIKRYFRLKRFFTQGNFDKMPELIDYMLSAREENDLQLLDSAKI